MTLGPLSTYVPPSVLTRTLRETNTASLVAGARIPAIVGVGEEDLEQINLEMVRGSSASQDQQIFREDASASFVMDETNPSAPILGSANGLTAKLKVRNFPIVDGQGLGRVSNDTRSVAVTVDGIPVAVSQVRGAQGTVTLQVPPQAGSNIRVTYYFHRSDTSFTDDVSYQVTTTAAVLMAPAIQPYEIIEGVTDTLVLTVNGLQSTVTLAVGSFTAQALKTQVDQALISGLTTSVTVDPEGNSHLTFSSSQDIVVGAGNANGALGFSAGRSTSRNRAFRVFNLPVVDGSDGGITTTDPTKVTALVNGTQVVVESVDGTNGIVTLPFAPAAGSTVTLSYFHNTWQDTFDYLPNTFVTGVIRAGFSSGRNDYIDGTDFIVQNPTPDTSVVLWGASYTISPTRRTTGATVFDDTQIIPTLVDDKLWNVPCTRYVDASVVPAVTSSKVFVLPEVPTLGNGRDTPLGQSLYTKSANGRLSLPSSRPDLVSVYTGTTLRDALNRVAAKVVAVDATTRQITLRDAVPPDHNVYASFNYSRLTDDTYVLTNKTAGAVGSGQFEVFSTIQNKNVNQIRFGSKSGLAQTVQWPRGVETITDAHHTGAGTAVSETVTVTFSTEAARAATYTVTGAAPYNFYASNSDTWRTAVNGNAFVTNLATATKGYLVSSKVALSAGNLTVVSGANVLSLTVDGTDVDVTLTVGSRTPAQIVTEINGVLDALPAFSGTAPNTLCSQITIGTSAVFVLHSYSVPAALPGGFDANSYVAIRQGTAQSLLGFTVFDRANGSPKSLNKPATILGTIAGAFNITAGLNDELNIRVDGVDYAVTLTAGAAVTAATLVTLINGVPGLSGVASAGTLANLNHLRLTSTKNNAGSSIRILEGSANAVLGLTTGDTASYTPVTAQEVVNSLMATAGFVAQGFAHVSTLNGNSYVTIESTATGASSSSIAFTSGSASAFNTLSGTGVVTGTSGDNGEDARDVFTVSSNKGTGSSGTGYPGQTYTDARTGLRFTVLAATSGSYTSSGSFTLIVSETWAVTPSVPYLLGGVELIVTDTVGIAVDDATQLRTFNPGGLEPAVGDYYYISYRYSKQDYSPRLFQTLKSIEANYGKLSVSSQATLGSYLSIINGATLVAIKQVLKEPNQGQASAVSYLSALNELTKPLPGNIRPDIVVPLTGSTVVMNGLLQHVETQSDERNQSERLGLIGVSSGTTPIVAQTIAKSLLSNRMVLVYPDSAVITLTDELGSEYDQVIDGWFLAAALAGSAVSSAVDVATPYTRRRLVGFTRLPRILDPVEANQTAIAGITLLEELTSLIRVRQGLTTDMSSLLTRLPTVTQISDYVQQQHRVTLDPFIGTKFLNSRTNEVEKNLTDLFKSLTLAEIVGAFTGIAADVDPVDPTIMRVEDYYQPIFPLLYILTELNIRARI